MQWIFKVGNKKPSTDIAVRMSYWADCQLVDIRPAGFYPEKSTKSFCIVEDGKDYWKVRGSINWKSTIAKVYDLKKYLCVADDKGRYAWDVGYNEETKPQRVRDWFLDYKYLLDQNIINKPTFDRIYDKSREQIIYTDRDVTQYLFHEDEKTRLLSEYSNIGGSVSTGTYQIGTGGGADYATWTLFEADIAVQLTGNLTGEGQNEQTDISAAIVFDTDTNTHLLKLTAESGAEHTGGAYGNGARINYGTADWIEFDESASNTLDNIEISKLAIDAIGASNTGIDFRDGSIGSSWLCNRMLIKCDTNTVRGIVCVLASAPNLNIRNCIIYGASSGEGIKFTTTVSSVCDISNNTVIGCNEGIDQTSAVDVGTLTTKNNLCQAGVTADFVDAGAGFGTHSKNLSEDATSPDAAYQSKDVHTNSVFKNYGADDYRLDSGGDATNLAIVDDGDDLSGTFTDDIEGQARSTWYIGASEIVAAGGLSIPVAMHHYLHNLGK